jgi:cytochrome d ubiquinol oxidase subunit II
MLDAPANPPVMLWVVSGFLALSLLLYCLLAGADFGAGILEIFLRPSRRASQRSIIDKAMGPVWEANHMWLILIVVILFTGFPEAYSRISIQLHIPLTAMLMGIIARGCAFTFRHYDAVKGRSQKAYTAFFMFFSVWTPFWLGVVLGALVPGGIHSSASSYFEGFIQPWLRPFPLTLGFFTLCLFAFLAATYLIGESPAGEVRLSFLRRARIACIVMVLAGGLVFGAAQAEGIGLLSRFLHSPVATGCLLLATVSLPILWVAWRKDWVWFIRVLAGAQVTLILTGWLWTEFPVMVHMPEGDLTIYNAHAPAISLNYLGCALLVGSLFILPALFYLFRVFKGQKDVQV